jgi:2-polyprenyl-6-methoxyphenol hydroxylase-like FAD-dependent oxidoreductase
VTEKDSSAKHIIVIGGSITGLGAGLALTSDGHRVTILEADSAPMPKSHLEAFDWDRRGSPQTKHSHALLARLYLFIRDRAPGLLEKILACGAEELGFVERAREIFGEFEIEDGDEDIVLLACRRSTFEWVLRRHILDTGLVDFRDGVSVTGLSSIRDASTGLPRVTGVRVEGADGSVYELTGDLVVDASGRRSRLRQWLPQIGTKEVRQESEPCGIFYTSRFYRLHDETKPPELEGGIVGADLGYLKVGLFPGDSRIFSLTLAADPHDDVMRKILHEPGFDAAAAAIPVAESWIRPEISKPVSGVNGMANLNNVRRFLVENGEPLALGVCAIGDALIHTNPISGRGCSLGWVGAFALADALREHPDDLRALALDLDARSDFDVVPWYEIQLRQDRDAIDVAEALRRGEDPYRVVRDDGTNNPKAFMRSVLREGLLPAIREDLTLMRIFMRAMNLLEKPDDLMGRPEVMQRVMVSYQKREEREPLFQGPARSEMLEILERVEEAA